MKAATREFLKQRFTEYYHKGNLSPPPSLEQREWGFMFFDADYPEIRMRRHMGFGERKELLDYIRAMVPAHAYYSSAYYGAPSAGTMAEKKWSGADLIFDLDADHIIRADYGTMLARVKEETEKLITMLTDELGFASRGISVVFSGGRGYHIHIRDPLVRIWGSPERRELVDYVCGTGLDPALVLSGAMDENAGWGMRFVHTIRDYVSWLRSMDPQEAQARLTQIEGIGEKSAQAFLARIQALPADMSAEQVGHLLGTKVLSAEMEEKGELWNRIRSRAALADEPVTTDTKRLIRMPTSLHGGSGFRVTPLSVSELSSFDPLTDAVIFGTREVQVDATRAVVMPMFGSTYAIVRGENRVPEALAVFLCCRGLAELSGGSAHAA